MRPEHRHLLDASPTPDAHTDFGPCPACKAMQRRLDRSRHEGFLDRIVDRLRRTFRMEP